MAKTVEELEKDLAKLQGDFENASKENEALKNENKALADEVEALKLELAANEEKVSTLTKEVPGTFDCKKTGNTYKFKKGHLKLKYKGETFKASEVIQNKEIMSELIKIGAGCIEVVEK